MRQIGTLPSESEARTFADYLLTQSIRTSVEQEGEAFAVWILDEDQVQKAKEELEIFRNDPEGEKYALAKSEADALRNKEIKRNREMKKKVVRANETWNQSTLQRAPVTVTLIALSVVAVLLTTNWQTPMSFGDQIEPVATWLFYAPVRESNQPGTVFVPLRPFQAIFQGEVWRLITPIFMHGDPLHLLFNMLWLKDLGSVVEARRGRGKYLALVLGIAAVSNSAQAIFGAYFLGMSGVVFGLFGYVWMQSRFVPSSGFYMPPNVVMLMMFWMALCYTGLVGAIANAAHTVGLLAGMIIGYAPKLWRDLSR